jgi:hypothetical protein
MPDQPDDPLHYEMKIPPEPENAPLNKEEQHAGSNETADESGTRERPGKKDGDANPPRSSGH